MVRAFQLVVCAAVLCAAVADASARRAMCDGDEGPISLPADPLRTPVAEVHAASLAGEEPHPPETRICLPGVADDAGCRPHSTLPGPGLCPLPVFTEIFVIKPAAQLPPVAVQRSPRLHERQLQLAAGFARRLERPPRPTSAVA